MLNSQNNTSPNGRAGTVAYVLKGFPRLSEMFIASEIYRLEQAGVRLRLYVIKQSEERAHHEVVDRIKSRPEYLPPTTSLSATPLRRWLAENLPAFLPGLARVSFRHPVGTIRAALSAAAQALRARQSFWSFPRKQCLKEFLQATALADHLLRAPEVGHLHAHFAHGATTVTWLASLITGLPYSFTAHAKDIYCESLNAAGLLGRKLDAAKFVITCTEANRQYLQRLTKTSVHRIYHGLNADFSRLLLEQSEAPARNGHLRVLAVGRLVAKKGFDVLVDACGILKRDGVAFETVIIGETGEHEGEIKARIASQQLEPYIRLAGPMTQANLLREYRQSSAFCLPCRVLGNGDRDGIPNVMMEAMACGLPVVTTNISGIPELVSDDVNGLLVPPDNPAALAGALLRLKRDPALAGRLARASEKTVREDFGGERFVLQLANLFFEAMG